VSKVEADLISARGAIQFTRQGATASVDIPASGVIQVTAGQGSAITLGGGGATELLGIEYVDGDGDPVVLDEDVADLKFFRAAPGVVITIRHNRTEDLNAEPLPIPAEQRILTSSGNDFEVRGLNARGFYAYVQLVAGFRWYFTDDLSYAAAAPEDWPTSPTSIWGALDYIGSVTAATQFQGLVMPALLSTVSGTGYLVYRGPDTTIQGISVVLDGSLTVASSVTFATAINGTPVTNGDIAIAAVDSGAGEDFASTPTAANALTDGDVISVATSTLINVIPTLGAVTLLLGPA